MSRKKLIPLLIVSLLCVAKLASGQASDWKQIPKPPLHEFHPAPPQRIALPNGMVIFLQEDHELPLIRATARIRGGSREEPADKVGLVSIYGQSWRTGGTKTQSGDKLDDYLEARAAKVETGGGVDSTTIGWDCLKENFDDVFKLFVEVLREPEFREDKIALAKNQINTAISRRNDDPTDIARREATKLAYGAGSPYARTAEYATVAAVVRQDLLSWHRTYVHPNNIILGVVGDFDSRAMEAKLKQTFSSWPKGPAAKKAEITFAGAKPGVYLVQKDDVNQSTIRMVHLGTTRDNPDYYAIEVLNEVIGGGFSSRLMANIRTKKGLAYSVGGAVGTAFDHPGVFIVGLGTKSSTTAAAMDALYEELDGLKTSPPTAEEMNRSKDAILNSFIFRFDSKQKVLVERMAYEFYGYPADFLERYHAGIEKVTADDLARVAQKYIHRDGLAVLIVGKSSDFDRPLTSFGPVTTLDITIPTGSATKKKQARSSNSEGRVLLSKVIVGLGDQSKINSVKSIRQKSNLLLKTPQGEMAVDVEQVSVFPDRSWQKMVTQMGAMSLVVSPSAAFMVTPMGSRDMPASQKESLIKSLKHEPLFVAQHASDPKFQFAAAGSEKISGTEARILDVDADGSQVRWFVDPESGRILRAAWQATGPSGPVEQVNDYAEWKIVDGISVPFKTKITRGGQEGGSADVKEFEINPNVDPKLFEKPAEKASQ